MPDLGEGPFAGVVEPLIAPPPPPALPPPVLSFAPETGWRAASRARRLLAVSPPLLLLLFAVGIGTASPVLIYAAVLMLAPAFGALARVLRPYPRGIPLGERRARHAIAAACMAVGVPLALVVGGVFAVAPTDDGADQDRILGLFWLGVPALLLGGLTVVWGVGASLVRAFPVRGRSADRIGPSAGFAHGVRGTELEHGGAGRAL